MFLVVDIWILFRSIEVIWIGLVILLLFFLCEGLFLDDFFLNYYVVGLYIGWFWFKVWFFVVGEGLL